MKINKYFIISEISNILMTLIILYSLAGAFCYFYDLPFGFTLIIGLALVILFTYFIRKLRFSYAGILAIAIQVLLMIGMFFLPLYLPNLVFIAIIAFAYLILNVKFFSTKAYDQFADLHLAFLVVPVIGYLFMDVKSNGKFMIFYFALSIIFILLYYCRLFFANAFFLASQRSNYDRMPYKEMIRNDSKLAVPFVVLSIIMMGLVNFDFMDDVVIKVYDYLIVGVRFVFHYVFMFLEWIINILISDPEEQITVTQQLENFEEETGKSIFFEVIAYIVLALVLLTVIIIVVKSIVNIIKSMKGARSSTKESVLETDMVEIKEKVNRKKYKKNDKNLSAIRKQYKKTVEKKAKEGYRVFLAHTPRERAIDLKKQKRYDIDSLSRQYEAERYGRS